MPVNTRLVESRVEWFRMIIGYLQLKSMAVWFHAHPESSYQSFEDAWPFILDDMMLRATHAAVEQLQIIVQLNLN